jgi:hypothetical protein
MAEKHHSAGQKTRRAKPNRKVQNYSQSFTVTAILRDMILSLLDTGFEKQHITKALGRLADEAEGDNWQALLDGRARPKQISSEAAIHASARRKGEAKS